MPEILIVQHMNNSGPGALGDALDDAGMGLDTRCIDDGDRLPASADGFAGLVVLGGVINALADDRYPHLAQTADLIAGFHTEEKPVLGVCLGAQLAARAFGACVHLGAVSELGFLPVALTDAAASDPVVGGLASPQWIMQWHDDTFDLPAGAQLLMTGETCRNQAFRLGRATYAFQCHFELTRELAAKWLDESRAEGHHRSHPEFHDRIAGEIDRHIDAALDFCRTVGTRWAGLVEK